MNANLLLIFAIYLIGFISCISGEELSTNAPTTTTTDEKSKVVKTIKNNRMKLWSMFNNNFDKIKVQKPSLDSESTTGDNNVSKLIKQKSFASYIKANICPVIEHQVYNGTELAFKQNISINFAVDCKGFPVYKSTHGVYLYRNIFGDWCHEKLNQFLPEVRCLQRCIQKRVLPTGIHSPVDSSSVEVYHKHQESKTVTNHRYVCAGVFDCSHIGCLNGGTCLTQASPITGLTEYKCQCPLHFSGLFCDVHLPASTIEPPKSTTPALEAAPS